jgi:hypothetical protein
MRHVRDMSVIMIHATKLNDSVRWLSFGNSSSVSVGGDSAVYTQP